MSSRDKFLKSNGWSYWEIGACEACTKEPSKCIRNFFCLCCQVYDTRVKTTTSPFRCCDQGGKGTLCPSKNACECPLWCACLEAWFCTPCAIAVMRNRIQKQHKIANSDWDCITQYCTFVGGGLWWTGAGVAMQIAHCACMSCLLTQLEEQLEHIDHHGSESETLKAPEIQEMK